MGSSTSPCTYDWTTDSGKYSTIRARAARSKSFFDGWPAEPSNFSG